MNWGLKANLLEDFELQEKTHEKRTFVRNYDTNGFESASI